MFSTDYSLKQMFYAQNENIIAKNSPNGTSMRKGLLRLSSLTQDTVSFGACKKNEFEGIDYVVVERYKAPIEKFNSNEDLQNWAEKEVKKIRQKDFGGRQQETQIQRKAMLKEWCEYVCNENDAYTPTIQLLILDAVTKNLKPDEDKIPPVLNKGVLADTVETLNKQLKGDNKYQFNFGKMYQTKLNALYLETEDNGSDFTGWVKIPSKQHDTENFEANVDKLKTLSHKNWCTKSYNAEPYLKDGDFHVYLENGKPKLGVRFVGDRIEEIQGEQNNGKIPVKYFDVAQKHIADNKLELYSNAKKEIEDAQRVKVEISKIKADIGYAIKNNDTKAILEYFGTKCEELPDGLLRISEFKPISEDYSYYDLGINENKLFENIKEIMGNVDFGKTKLTSLGKLEKIRGYADFEHSSITSLDELKKIGGDAYFSNSIVTDLGKLKYIGGSAFFGFSQITSLSKLKEIKRDAYFENSQITDLGMLEKIGWDAHFNNSQITSLGRLKKIKGCAHVNNSKITDPGELEYVKAIFCDKNFPIELFKNIPDVEFVIE